MLSMLCSPSLNLTHPCGKHSLSLAQLMKKEGEEAEKMDEMMAGCLAACSVVMKVERRACC